MSEQKKGMPGQAQNPLSRQKQRIGLFQGSRNISGDSRKSLNGFWKNDHIVLWETATSALSTLPALMNNTRRLQSLVLAPTKGLAHQTAHLVQTIGAMMSVPCTLLIGGIGMVSQAMSLGRKPHLIFTAAGRLLDRLENTKEFSLRELKYLVLDEADRLLDLGFAAVLDKLLSVLPSRTIYLVSATMSNKIESLQRQGAVRPRGRPSLKDSVRASAIVQHQTSSTLLQSYVFIPHKHKDVHLAYLLHERMGQMAIIFTRSVHETERLSIMLRDLGLPAIAIHGQLPQSVRLASLNKLRSRARNILIATDVAARGIDIPPVDLVINYDLPQESRTYIHRVARTARAGRSGMAISLVTLCDVEIWLKIEATLGKKVDEYQVSRSEAMVFAGRVSEAQRAAAVHMKELQGRRKSTRKAIVKRNRDDMDQDDG